MLCMCGSHREELPAVGFTGTGAVVKTCWLELEVWTKTWAYQ